MDPHPICTVLLALLPAAPAFALGGFDETKLTAAGGEAGDWFGRDVAVDGDRVVIGQVPWNDKDTEIGAAHVFRGCGDSLTLEAELVPAGVVPADLYGYSVAVDGDVVVVGAPQDDYVNDGVGGTGIAFVFRFDGTQWVEEQTLVPGAGRTEDRFGSKVAVDGDLIVVGAPYWDLYGNEGLAYVFRFDGSGWVEDGRIGTGYSLGSQAGWAIAVDAAQQRVVVGQQYANLQAKTNSGYVVISRHDGTTWVDEQGLFPADLDLYDHFGASVALSGDTILVGSPYRFEVSDENGAAYLFRHDGTQWIESQKLEASDGAGNDQFGRSVALSGGLAVIGAFGDDDKGSESGAAYLFGSDGSSFAEADKFVPADGAAGQRFGLRVAARGGVAVIGAYLDDELGTDAGAAYVYTGPAFLPYGSGLAGTGGLVPSLAATGDAVPGGTITLEIRDFVGGAPSVLVLTTAPASIPAFGGTLLVDLRSARILWSMMLPGAPGVAGDGDLDLNGVVPPGVSCISLFLQQLALDPAAPRNVSMTNGLEIFIAQ